MTETVKKVKIKASAAFVHDEGFYVRAGDVVEVTEAFLESQNAVCDLFEIPRHEVVVDKAEQPSEQAAAEQTGEQQPEQPTEQPTEQPEQDGGKGKGKGKGKSADGESDDL